MPLHKSWRWVGAFGPDVMLCVAHARVGVVRRSWWAVWERSDDERSARGRGDRLHEGTRAPFELTLEHGTPIEVTTGPMWTRKTPLRVTGSVLGREIDLPGLLDESAGRHPRRTAWRWSAGAGVAASGSAVVWNLVEGLHDRSPLPRPGTSSPRRSERTVWVDGEPHEVGAQPFEGLSRVGDLSFTALATRAKRENYLVIASDYEQPFGTFSGSLPVAGPLEGWGVMERHEALW
jgi:hypothetical protein